MMQQLYFQSSVGIPFFQIITKYELKIGTNQIIMQIAHNMRARSSYCSIQIANVHTFEMY